MKNIHLALLFAVPLLFGGCAGMPIDAALMGQLIGPHLSVSVPAEIPFPDQMTLQLGSSAGHATQLVNQALGALGSQSVEQRLGSAVKNSGIPFRSMAAEAFRKQLEDAKLFGSVTHDNGNLSVALGVSRWGLAYDEASRRLLPVLDIEASLTAPGLGVVWKASRSVNDLGADVLGKVSALSPAVLVSKPQGFGDAMGIVASELSRQLVDDLRKNPPHR